MKLQKFKLIKGEFLPKDSREIMQNVFSGKIQFHNMKNFSSQERYGKDDKIAVKRIPQLKKSLGKIIKMIEAAEKKILGYKKFVPSQQKKMLHRKN